MRVCTPHASAVHRQTAFLSRWLAVSLGICLLISGQAWCGLGLLRLQAGHGGSLIQVQFRECQKDTDTARPPCSPSKAEIPWQYIPGVYYRQYGACTLWWKGQKSFPKQNNQWVNGLISGLIAASSLAARLKQEVNIKWIIHSSQIF